tara:strand:- start:120 stop:1583 length:1464 start_codon:yes stop_codon:yes gene_type:complete
MKKILLVLFLITPFAFIAQNIKKSKKVKTSYLSYPKVDITNVDVSVMKVDFCAGDMNFIEKKVKKTTGLCKVKGASVTEAKAIDVFYYNVNVMKPASYIRVANSDNEILFMEKTSNEEKGSVDFGKKNCYWMESILKSGYEKEGGVFEKKMQKENAKSAMNNAQKFIDGALFFSYVPTNLVVFSVKSKDYDYSDINSGSEIAIEAYKGLKGDVENVAAQGKLNEALNLWEKALEESAPKEKDSRVNKKVTKALAENIATAYIHLMKYDKAEEAINKALVLETNITSPSSDRRKALLATITDLKKGYEVNKSVAINLKKVKVNTVNKPSSEYSQFVEDYKIHGESENAAEMKKKKEDYEDGVSDGSINPYQEYVVPVVTGNSLTLPNLSAKMMKLPAGEKLDEFPLEVLDLDITVLILRGNNIKSIPVTIMKLKDLKKLDLTKNQLTSLPIELGELKSLKKLILKGNSIPQDEINKIQSLLPECTIKL